MSVAAAVQRGQAPLLLESAVTALAWARSAPYPAPSPTATAAVTAPPSCGAGVTATVSPPLPSAAQLTVDCGCDEIVCAGIAHNLSTAGRRFAPANGSCANRGNGSAVDQLRPCITDQHTDPDQRAQRRSSPRANLAARDDPKAGANADTCSCGTCGSSKEGARGDGPGDVILMSRRRTHQHASTSTAAPDKGRLPAAVTAAAAMGSQRVAISVAAPNPSGSSATQQHQQHQQVLLSSTRSSSSGSTSGPRRPAYGVKTSQITSQISAAQRTRAAVVIQAAWRGFRIRRLYLRLIVWRLRPPAQGRPRSDVYWGLREFPPIPDLPAVSLFSLLGRPGCFRGLQRRVWFGLERPRRGQLRGQQGQPQQQGQGQQAQQAQLLRRRGSPLRLAVLPRAEADVSMSEVERILAGGFWRDEPGTGGGEAGGGAGGGGGGGEGLSMYMRAKMKQEEREAEEALQMLSYEPHDLKHLLGSLRERTLERLGGLGRTIGETISSGLLARLPGHMQGLARSLPRSGRWGAAGGGRRRAGARPRPSGLLSGGAPGSPPSGSSDLSLRVPLLTVVDPEGHSHTECPPGGLAIPIAVNWQRYRSRNHVTRMSF